MAPPETSGNFHTRLQVSGLLTLVYAEKAVSLGMAETSLMSSKEVDNGFRLGWQAGKKSCHLLTTCHTNIKHTSVSFPNIF